MGADASPEAGRKAAGRLVGRTADGRGGGEKRSLSCRVVSCEAASAAGRSLWSLDPAEKACRDQDQNPDPDPTEVLLAGAVGSGRARTRHDGGASATNSAASGRPGPKRLELAVPAACRIQAKRTGAATRTRSRLPCPPTSPGSAARLGMFSPPAGTTRDAYYNHASVRRSPCHRPAPGTRHLVLLASLALRSRQWQGHATASWVGIGAPVHPDRKPRMAATAIMGRRTASAFV